MVKAARDGKMETIRSLLDGRNKTVDVSNLCMLAIIQAAEKGHLELIDFLLPWSTREDPNSPVANVGKYDSSLVMAADNQHWDVFKRLAPVAMGSSFGRSFLIQVATEADLQDVFQTWLNSTEVDSTHDAMVKAKGWYDLDTLAMAIGEPKRAQWLAQHPQDLPRTQAWWTATQRSEKGAALGPSGDVAGTRRRWRA